MACRIFSRRLPYILAEWLAQAKALFGSGELSTGGRSGLTPYRPYLQQRWEAGEHSAAQLWHELRA